MRSPLSTPPAKTVVCRTEQVVSFLGTETAVYYNYLVSPVAASVIGIPGNSGASLGNGPCVWVSAGLRFILSIQFLQVELKDRSFLDYM